MNSQNKKIALNSVVIFVRLCIVSVVSLLSARFVLQALGASDYGLYNVVGGIVGLLNILNTAMITTTYRYIAYELGKTGNVNKVFNVSLSIHVALALLVLLVGLSLGEFYVSNYLNVPEGSIDDAHFVLRISILTAMFSTMLVPFQGLLTAYEKFHVIACFDILCQLLRLGAVVVLVHATSNQIRYYSLIMMAYNVIYASLFYIYSFSKFHDVVKFRFYRDRALYKDMISFAFWILFGALSSVGQIQGSAMIINYFFSTVANAAFAVANQVQNFVSMFAGNLGQAAVPQITKSFSGGNQDRSLNLACYISKYTFIMMLAVVFPLCIDIDFILDVWLKNPPEDAGVFCKLTMLNGLIGCLGAGLPALIQATGKIKVFQLILSTMSLLSLPIAFVCYKFDCPVYTILNVYCIVSLLIALIRIVLLRKVLNFDVFKLFNISYLRLLYISIPLVAFYMWYNPTDFSIPNHIIGLICAELYLFVVICIVGLDKKERGLILNFIQNRVHK